MRSLILLLFLLTSIAQAHVGFENDTEIRVFPDRMRVVIRTSIPFAQALLGEGAPLLANEAGQAAAKPLLNQAAAELISITAGGKPLAPSSSECLFEVQNDVAFILNFSRPTEWPVVTKAEFFPRFANLESGTMAAFDCTASRFSREVEPLQKIRIDPRNPSLTFSLGSTMAEEKTTLHSMPPVAHQFWDAKKVAAIIVFFSSLAAIVFLARRRWSMPD